jgi:hypothetical protein
MALCSSEAVALAFGRLVGLLGGLAGGTNCEGVVLDIRNKTRVGITATSAGTGGDGIKGSLVTISKHRAKLGEMWAAVVGFAINVEPNGPD